MLDIQHPQHHCFHPRNDLIMLNDQPKAGPSSYPIQIIQLVEGPPPPPRVRSDEDEPYSDYDSDAWTSSASSSDEDEDEETSSYCSSDDDDQAVTPEDEDVEMQAASSSSCSDTYPLRMKRILAWREDFSSHLSAISESSTSGSSSPSPGKRKLERKAGAASDAATASSLGAHSCPACDASFDDPQSLLEHGRDGSNEACVVAVEYAFEQ